MKLSTQITRCGMSSIIAVGCTLALSGCGHYVSDEEYLHTSSMSQGSFATESQPGVYGYVPPYGNRSVDPQLPLPRYESTPRIIIRDDFASSDSYVNSTTSATDAPISAASYRSSVRSELNSLQRELMLIRARANQKGAAGLAAIEPALRDFDMSVDMIDKQMNELSANTTDTAQWNEEALETQEYLEDSRQAVREAAMAVDRIPSND